MCMTVIGSDAVAWSLIKFHLTLRCSTLVSFKTKAIDFNCCYSTDFLSQCSGNIALWEAISFIVRLIIRRKFTKWFFLAQLSCKRYGLLNKSKWANKKNSKRQKINFFLSNLWSLFKAVQVCITRLIAEHIEARLLTRGRFNRARSNN